MPTKPYDNIADAINDADTGRFATLKAKLAAASLDDLTNLCVDLIKNITPKNDQDTVIKAFHADLDSILQKDMDSKAVMPGKFVSLAKAVLNAQLNDDAGLIDQYKVSDHLARLKVFNQIFITMQTQLAMKHDTFAEDLRKKYTGPLSKLLKENPMDKASPDEIGKLAREYTRTADMGNYLVHPIAELVSQYKHLMTTLHQAPSPPPSPPRSPTSTADPNPSQRLNTQVTSFIKLMNKIAREDAKVQFEPQMQAADKLYKIILTNKDRLSAEQKQALGEAHLQYEELKQWNTESPRARRVANADEESLSFKPKQ